MKNIFKINGLISFLVLIVAGYLVISEALFINKCELVKAKIINVDFHKENHNSEDDPNDWYNLTLKTIPTGKTASIVFKTDFSDPQFNEGDIVELYYYPKSPEDSEIKNFWDQWGGALICAGVFLFDLIFIAIFFLKSSDKKEDNANSNPLIG